jgi:hypothetical protein
MATERPSTDRTAVAAFQEQVFAAALGTFTTYALYLGSRLGYYDALADAGPSTSDELAAATGTDATHASGSEQQAVVGVLTCENPAADPDARRFSLPTAHSRYSRVPTAPTTSRRSRGPSSGRCHPSTASRTSTGPARASRTRRSARTCTRGRRR